MKNKLKDIRNSKEISQEELSQQSGVSRTTISALENNTLDNVQYQTMLKLAQTLNEPIENIFFTNV